LLASATNGGTVSLIIAVFRHFLLVQLSISS